MKVGISVSTKEGKELKEKKRPGRKPMTPEEKAAAAAERAAERKRTRITDLKLYVKPEEHIAYYVVNEKFNGKISF